MIVETYILSATDTDVLDSPSRLASIPYGGTLILEFQASINDATNHFLLDIQLPNGQTPLKSVHIPANNTTGLGAMNANDKYVVSFPVSVGGHIFVSLTLGGTADVFVRATLV